MAFETPDEIMPARAYIYNGDWVADCTRTGCGNVEFLYQPAVPGGPRVHVKPIFVCSNCGQQSVIDWPGERELLMAALSRRPVPQTRNWYPADHPVAVNFRIPHGQSVRDLMDENEEHGVK